MNNKLVDNFLCVFNLIKNFDKIILFLFLPFRSCLCIAFARLSIKNRKKTLNQIISKFFKHFLKDFSCESHSYCIFSSSVNIFGNLKKSKYFWYCFIKRKYFWYFFIERKYFWLFIDIPIFYFVNFSIESQNVRCRLTFLRRLIYFWKLKPLTLLSSSTKLLLKVITFEVA